MTPEKMRRYSAEVLLSRGQIVLGLLLLVGASAWGYTIGGHRTLQAAVALITLFYIVTVGFTLLLSLASGRYRFPPVNLPDVYDPNLPAYSVIVALRGEERSVGRLVRALTRLAYPVEKLQILFAVEEFDQSTQAAIEKIGLPPYMTMVLVPFAGPLTKPKALNWAFSNYATGDLIAVYDAEDSPDPWQLLKAVARFREAETDIGCLQSSLVFWNPRPSLVSTMYFAEYAVHFRVLRGLAFFKLILPLGGTSNHFVRHALNEVALNLGTRVYYKEDGTKVEIKGPWGEHNVTEDAELAGLLLAEAGCRVEMLDSYTFEEAPAGYNKARRQRSRWIKGYLQTGLVFCRRPLWHMRRMGILRWVAYELMMLGAPVALLLNPITWGATLLYIVTRWIEPMPAVTAYIHGLFPAPVFYAGVPVMVVGNATLFYQKLIGTLRYQRTVEAPATEARGPKEIHLQEQLYGLTLRQLLTPAWWAFTSISAYQALAELFLPGLRSKWHKTEHGDDAEREEEIESRVMVSELQYRQPELHYQSRDPDQGARSHPARQSPAATSQSLAHTVLHKSAVDNGPEATHDPAPDLPGIERPTVSGQRLSDRRVHPRRNRVPRVATAILVMLVAAGATLAWQEVGRGSPAGGGTLAGRPVDDSHKGLTAAAAAGTAAEWVSQQVSHNVIVACDPRTCSVLQARGVPAANLLVMGATAPDPLGAELVVATPALRDQFGTRLDSIYAPTVMASFGSGPGQVTVRVIAPGGAAAYLKALRRDVAARAAAGAQLLANKQITVTARARMQLAAGEVDSRLLMLLPVMAAVHPILVLAFGDPGPSASPGIPLCSADLSGSGRAAGMTDAHYQSWLVAFDRAQLNPFAGGTTILRQDDQLAIRVQFSRPSPLGLLTSS